MAADRQYQTIAAICEAFGVNRSTFYARLRRGLLPDQALSLPVRHRALISKAEIGKRLRSAGVSPVTYQSRRRRGWTEEQALKPVGLTMARSSRTALPDGQAAVRLAEKNGVHRRKFYRRIARGVPIERAMLP